MAEENRGKRRKQANPRRNRECSLGSEGEDEGCVWGTDVQDEKNGQDKISLTPSEGTEAGSPARFTRDPSLSPSLEQWDETENMALPTTPGESEKSAYAHKETRVEDWTRYDFLMQLRKVSLLSHQQDSQQLNGSALSYHTGGMQDDTSSTVSPGAQESPERKDVDPGSPDAIQIALHMCPFCQQTYQHGPYLREHIKECQERERESAHSLCPICGYSTLYRAQMEQHMALHVQVKEKNPVSDANMEKRKFKCTQCGKAFKYKHHLKEHLRIHSGEKPYECSNCKKRFSHSGSYSSHLSSKKCLSGGGPGNGSYFNGHTHSAFSFPSPTTAGSRNNSKGKSSPYAPLSHYFTEQTANQGHADTMRASDLGRPWDAAAALRMDVFQGTTLLPSLRSGLKFEELLQEMLRKEVGMEEQRGSRQEKDQANKTEIREGENDVPVVNVPCPWCFHLFPNEVVLKQHERYLCKAKSKEEQEVAQLHYHREGSPLNFLHVSQIPHVNRKMPTTPNGMSIELSSPQQASWQSVSQQLLVPLQSPMHLRPDSSHAVWLNKQTGSPTDSILMSPKSPSVQNRQHPGFSSPPCLDLSITSPSRPPQQRPSPRSGDSQNEPLDLSIPKICTTSNTSKEAREQACNGSSPQGDRRDVELLTRKLTSPSQHHVGGAYPPLFGSAVFRSYPFFNSIIPNGLAAMGHNGVTPLSLTPPSPGFLSPMTYMMEAESETMLKRMQQERIAISDARNRSSLDYLSLMEEGMDGDSGPGRKRLRKTEEGLYACDICDKSFQKSSSLLRHKYEHTGKRPHECQICKKAFKHKHHLIEHSRLHSGEKPYQCDKCGKRFSHSGSYSQHMNHRYAFCGQDHDPDGPIDDQLGGDMTLYTSSHGEANPETEDAPLTLEGTATFFSNSILDRTPLGFKAENGAERESSVSSHDRNEERRMDIEKGGDLEMATEKEKKEEEVEGQDTKSNHHSNKIKAEQNGRTEEKRDSQAINLETV